MTDLKKTEDHVKETRRRVFNAIAAPIARGPITQAQTTRLIDDLINAVRIHDAETVRSMEEGVVRMGGRRVSDIDVVAGLIEQNIKQ